MWGWNVGAMWSVSCAHVSALTGKGVAYIWGFRSHRCTCHGVLS